MPAGPGAQLSVGVQRIGRMFSAGASAIVATRNYRDVASMNGDGVLRKQLSAYASLSMKRLGGRRLRRRRPGRFARRRI